MSKRFDKPLGKRYLMADRAAFAAAVVVLFLNDVGPGANHRQGKPAHKTDMQGLSQSVLF
jgi:hypothetical protein